MSNKETANDYDDVLITLANRRWRVISCKDGIQWILQRNVSFGNEGVRDWPWKADSFCRTREALIRLTKQKANPTAGELAILSGLPDYHP